MVTNAGSGNADATVTDPLTSSLVGATYTATETGGATGFTPSGSGSINDTNVGPARGSTITYTLQARISQAATGSLLNAATVTDKAGATTNPALVTGLDSPTGIAVSGGDVFVTNSVAGTVSEYTTSGATVNASLITGLDDPAGIAVLGRGSFRRRDQYQSISECNATTGAA